MISPGAVSQQTRVYPYPLGAGSARPNPKMGAPDPENPLFLGFSVLRGGFRDHGLRPWSRKGPDHRVGVDPERKPRILVKKSVVLVKRENGLLKRSSPCFPGFSVQGLVLANPSLRFTKTTDSFTKIPGFKGRGS